MLQALASGDLTGNGLGADGDLSRSQQLFGALDPGDTSFTIVLP
ncbi:MAG: hypothetical protein QM695_09875 [Micropruina sp.]